MCVRSNETLFLTDTEPYECHFAAWLPVLAPVQEGDLEVPLNYIWAKTCCRNNTAKQLTPSLSRPERDSSQSASQKPTIFSKTQNTEYGAGAKRTGSVVHMPVPASATWSFPFGSTLTNSNVQKACSGRNVRGNRTIAHFRKRRDECMAAHTLLTRMRRLVAAWCSRASYYVSSFQTSNGCVYKQPRCMLEMLNDGFPVSPRANFRKTSGT